MNGLPERAEYTIRYADGGALELGLRTRVMGILNITPDSFSDGGRFSGPDSALEAAQGMLTDGADLLDVGGESTRPGAGGVSVSEEADRVLPVIERIRENLDIRISVDTRKAEVARQALAAGADMVNDVSGFGDPGMIEQLRTSGAPAVVMHMRGTPRTMQRETRYDDIAAEVAGALRDRTESALAAGVASDKIIVDPGLGFGKSGMGSLRLLKQLDRLKSLGRPILIGASRKSFIGAALDLPVEERLEGSLAVAVYAAAHGAHIIRTHDVRATVRAVRMLDAIDQA